MQQQEAVTSLGQAIAAVEPRDAEDGNVQQGIIARLGLGIRVYPVGKQREVQLVVGRGQVVDFQAVQVFLDGRARIQHHRHGDQGAQLLRDAVAQCEAWQPARAHAARHGAVDQRHGDVHGGHRAQKA